MRRATATIRPGLNPVLLLLDGVGLLGLALLPVLTHAPNRLLSGRPVPLHAVLAGPGWLLAVPGAVLLAGAALPRASAAVALAGSAFAALLTWRAGAVAAALAAGAPPAARTGLASGFWVMLLAAALAVADALRRLRLAPAPRILAGIACTLPVAALVASGQVAQLSVMREYAARHDVFTEAVLRHLLLVAATLAPTLAIGLPLGALAQARAGWRGPVFTALNVVQTIPSIALFGLLLAPLAGLARAVPALAALGVGGIGMAPAIIALTLYALLPVARNVAAGLDAVPPSAIDAARGMGMTRRQVFWQVSAPIALPVILSGVRITLVQAIGLAAVAALIGAGGLGAIIFQGLFANALDLVMLGVIPLVLLALLADAALRLLQPGAWRPGGA